MTTYDHIPSHLPEGAVLWANGDGSYTHLTDLTAAVLVEAWEQGYAAAMRGETTNPFMPKET